MSLKVINGIENFPKNIKTTLTVGTFDGVHLGHQKVIEKLNAKKGKGKSVVLTLFPHPRMVLQKDVEIKLINTIDEKIKLLEGLDLDYLIIQEFTPEFAKQSALHFVKDVLVNQLHIEHLIIGYDHRFGKNREGDYTQLEEYGILYDFDLEEISVKEIQDIAISSTKIRNAIDSGEIEKVNNYLGYNFSVSGEVVRGKGLGNQFNYPTVNINIKEEYKILPKDGVYLTKVLLKDATFYGIMNIGMRPTVNGTSRTVEVHILDFKKAIYGDFIKVEILKHIRNEQKFDSLNTLYEQIKQDEIFARKLLTTFFD